MEIGDFVYHRPAGIGEACALLAELGDRTRLVVDHGAVETSVVAGELVAGDAGVVVAPQYLRLVPVHAHVEPALTVNVVDRRRVVAVDRVEAVGVQVISPLEESIVMRSGLVVKE